MEYEYSWSELLLPPLEFDFGPKLKPGERHIVQFRNPTKFLNQQTVRPIPNGIFSKIDFSQYIIQMAVNSAVYLKQSTIPDRLTDITENVVEFTSVMDQHYAIKQKVKKIGHVFVNAFVSLWTTMIAALLQAMIAYHNTPTINEPRRKRLLGDDRFEDSCLVSFCVGGHNFTTQLINIVPRKKTKLGRLAFERKSNSPDSTVFIDRDGTHFRHVLNFLRGSESVSHITDRSVLADLLEEARFYELPDLEEKIMNLLVGFINSEQVKKVQ